MHPLTLLEYGLALAGGVLAVGLVALFLFAVFCFLLGGRRNATREPKSDS